MFFFLLLNKAEEELLQSISLPSITDLALIQLVLHPDNLLSVD